MFNNNGVPTLFFSQMTSSDGTGQVWGALQTFGYQLISGGGELMNAACLHHRHRRHSLLPTTAFLSRHCTLRPRSLPFLLPLPALPSLCLAPTPLTHTSSLPASQPTRLATLHHHQPLFAIPISPRRRGHLKDHGGPNRTDQGGSPGGTGLG